MATISPRLAEIVAALPLARDSRVLEIGCGPGAAARAVAQRVPDGHVLAVDRSATAVKHAQAGCAAQLAVELIDVRCVAVENLVLLPDEDPYDLAFAVRVGCLDGRHPRQEAIALSRIAAALVPDGRLFIDGGSPLREIPLAGYRTDRRH